MRRLVYIPIVLAAAAAFFLAGCGFTGAGDQARQAIVTEGAKAYDEGLKNAELFVCQAASVGSVQRRYGRSIELAEAWRTLCQGDGAAAVEIITAPDD